MDGTATLPMPSWYPYGPTNDATETVIAGPFKVPGPETLCDPNNDASGLITFIERCNILLLSLLLFNDITQSDLYFVSQFSSSTGYECLTPRQVNWCCANNDNNQQIQNRFLYFNLPFHINGFLRPVALSLLLEPIPKWKLKYIQARIQLVHKVGTVEWTDRDGSAAAPLTIY